jgi:hypothetical protein
VYGVAVTGGAAAFFDTDFEATLGMVRMIRERVSRKVMDDDQ